MSTAGGIETKSIKDEGYLHNQNVEDLPVQGKSTYPKPLGEGVLEMSTAGGIETKSIKDEGFLHNQNVEGLPVQEKSTYPKPLGEGVLEMSTAGGMDTVDLVRKEYKTVFSEQKRYW